jgi:hypothetical protein
MGTRSAIGMQFGDIVKAVYCHWDGYPENNGRILIENYTARTKTAHLISLGNLSVLGPMVEPDPEFPHTKHQPQRDVCVFKGRDYDEPGNEYQVFDCSEEYRCEFGSDVEYLYLLTTDGNWLVCDSQSIDGRWQLLADVLEQEEA